MSTSRRALRFSPMKLKSYQGLETDFQHAVINHAVEYVRENVYTNGLETFWSLLKRGLHGTYISVEPFHLFRYIDEQSFRFNARKLTDEERFAGRHETDCWTPNHLQGIDWQSGEWTM